jgi:CO/xanthine dehydrogenase Mo-binding subunit
MNGGNIGRSRRRLEDPRFLTGQGRYVDDVDLPGQLHGIVLRSPYGHAAIEGVDTAAARAMPGVRGVFTAADLDADGIGPLQWARGHDRLRAVAANLDEMAQRVLTGASRLGARPAAERGRLRGLGIACFLETSRGTPGERAEIRFEADRHVDNIWCFMVRSCAVVR